MSMLRIIGRKNRIATIKARIQFGLDEIGSGEFVAKRLSLVKVLVMKVLSSYSWIFKFVPKLVAK